MSKDQIQLHNYQKNKKKNKKKPPHLIHNDKIKMTKSHSIIIQNFESIIICMGNIQINFINEIIFSNLQSRSLIICSTKIN